MIPIKGKSMVTGLAFYLLEAFGSKDTFHLANCYLFRGHIQSALRNYEKCLEENNPKAMYVLAILYEIGIGYEEDHSQYLYWMQKAAQLGHKGAIGECYIDGNGYTKNVQEGFNILLNYARSTNESFVHGSVAGYYLKGAIISKNITEAKKWYELSAKNLNPFAQEILKTL